MFSCMKPGWFRLMGALAASACAVGAPTRGYPLHGSAHERLQDVARLHGYVRTVDGRDVSEHGHHFELLPGCHVVGTPTKWGGAGTDAWVTADTGQLLFVLNMQEGHEYEIRVHEYQALGRVEIEAIEKDMHGETIAKHLPVREQAAIEECMDRPSEL